MNEFELIQTPSPEENEEEPEPPPMSEVELLQLVERIQELWTERWDHQKWHRYEDVDETNLLLRKAYDQLDEQRHNIEAASLLPEARDVIEEELGYTGKLADLLL